MASARRATVRVPRLRRRRLHRSPRRRNPPLNTVPALRLSRKTARHRAGRPRPRAAA